MCNLVKWPQESDAKYLLAYSQGSQHGKVISPCWAFGGVGVAVLQVIEVGSKDVAETERDRDPLHTLIHAAEAGLHTATSFLLTAAQFLLSEK